MELVLKIAYVISCSRIKLGIYKLNLILGQMKQPLLGKK